MKHRFSRKQRLYFPDLGIQKNGQAIQTCNPDVNLTFTVVKGGNHGGVERYFREDKIYNWMLSQAKFIP